MEDNVQMSDGSSPIQNLDSLDIVGERKDGGVDLAIVCSGPLDDSPETLKRLAKKIENYLTGATHTNFATTYPAAKHGPTRIFVCSDFAVSSVAHGLINSLAKKAEQLGVELSVGDPIA